MNTFGHHTQRDERLTIRMRNNQKTCGRKVATLNAVLIFSVDKSDDVTSNDGSDEIMFTLHVSSAFVSCNWVDDVDLCDVGT